MPASVENYDAPSKSNPEFVESFVRLSAWHVWRRMKIGTESLSIVLNQETDVYRQTVFYDGVNHPSRGFRDSRWEAVAKSMEEVWHRTAADESSEVFESVCLDSLRPYLVEPWHHPARKPKWTTAYECWKPEIVDDGILLHVENVYAPESPLGREFARFAATLKQLLVDARRFRRGLLFVRCCRSWLNSVPRFQLLFPPSWVQSTCPEPVTWGLGAWGQFRNRRGAFHEKNGARFRSSGRWPFPKVSCQAALDEVIEHLKTTFPALNYHVASEDLRRFERT